MCIPTIRELLYMTDLLKITKSIVVHFAHICAYGVETVNWDIYVQWKDKGLRATSFSQVLVLVNIDSVNGCIIECC